MRRDEATALIRALDALTGEQHAALRARDYAGLDALAQKAAPLIERLEAAAPRADPDQLDRLRLRAQRLQTLLGAAQDGVRAAQTRLRALREIEAGFNSYGRDGARQTVGPGQRGKLERRA